MPNTCQCYNNNCSNCSCLSCTLNCACHTKCQDNNDNALHQATKLLDSLLPSLQLAHRAKTIEKRVKIELRTKVKIDESTKKGNSSDAIVHPAQKRIAKQLEELMDRELPFPATVKKLCVLYVCPSRNTLHSQTDKRVSDFQCRLDETYGPLVDFQTVKANIGKDAGSTFSTFANNLASQRQWFFIILHDECHWGADAESQTDLHFANVLKKYNSAWRNLRILEISATPWNQFPYIPFSPDTRILPWQEREDGGRCYVGLKELLDNGKIIEWQPVKPMISNLDTSAWKAREVKAFAVILDWCCALVQASGLLSDSDKPRWFNYTEPTLQAVNSILSGDLALLRLPAGGWGKLMYKKFTWLLHHLGLGRGACCLEATMEGDNQLPKFWADKLKSLQTTAEAPWFRTFQDLQGLPCLVIVVEKARMGDSMPSNLATLDLRARYNKQSSYACLLQDVGRAAGWTKNGELTRRPTVLMSSEALYLLKNPGSAQMLDLHLRSKEKNSERSIWMERFNSTRPFVSGRERILTRSRENAISLIHLELRFILSAEPQIGKTGAVLYFVELLCRRWRPYK